MTTEYIFTPKELQFLSIKSKEIEAKSAAFKEYLVLIALQQGLEGNFQLDPTGTKLIVCP